MQLVLIGATAEGKKELVRGAKSAPSWRELSRSRQISPSATVRLGFWKAIDFPSTRHQRRFH
jgi:hypothetical protein